MGRLLDGQGGRHDFDLYGYPDFDRKKKWERCLLEGAAAANHGLLAVAAFSIGLLLSHALIAIVSLWFHDFAKKVRPLLPVTMYAACIFSFVLGVSYLLE
ncbi:hypothetical protein [Paenibacillus sp. LPE1-1-1.1]|uniref:hypothetical protein n=1 Tax=Paenibacillus sp. LPE1-1-1.1 TaxID=3135230 RepID=UPI00342E2D94